MEWILLFWWMAIFLQHEILDLTWRASFTTSMIWLAFVHCDRLDLSRWVLKSYIKKREKMLVQNHEDGNYLLGGWCYSNRSTSYLAKCTIWHVKLLLPIHLIDLCSQDLSWYIWKNYVCAWWDGLCSYKAIYATGQLIKEMNCISKIVHAMGYSCLLKTRSIFSWRLSIGSRALSIILCDSNK